MLVSSASVGVSGGRIEGMRAASIDLPEPGGPHMSILCPPAAATSSARFALSRYGGAKTPKFLMFLWKSPLIIVAIVFWEESVTSSTITSLVDRRREVMREQAWLQREIKATEEAIVHIDAVIRLFDPGYDFDKLKAKRPLTEDDIFRPGEAPLLALNFLRECSGPVSTTEIAKYLLEQKGAPRLSPKRFQTLTSKIHAALQTQFRRGIIEKAGLSKTRAILWILKTKKVG